MKKYILFGLILLAAILRLYKLDSNPPSLYWDETSLGYNAYSILKTGRDEHGKFLPLTNFAAFGDYKPPGYIYAAVPSIAIFGLNEFAIRFPSALFGTLTVVLTYLLAKKIFENENIALLASFFLTISPWHLQFSRAAFEANLGLFFSSLGIYLFIKFARDHPLWIFPSAFAFLAAMYTFTGQRLFVPFILLILAIQFKQQITKNFKVIAVSTMIAAFFLWPLFKFALFTQEGRLRFNEVTIFRDLEPINESIFARQQDDFSLLSSIIHNRRLFYIRKYLIHYFDAFNPSFLFTRGDGNPRLSIQELGELYHFDIILLLFGTYFLFVKRQKYTWFIIFWILASPLGPATARETPHALRMIHILPTFQLVSAFGLYHLRLFIKWQGLFVILSSLVVTISIFYYLHMYYFHWPKEYSGEWQYGYKQAVEIVKTKYSYFDSIQVTKALGRPYVYFLLYMQIEPEIFQKIAQREIDRFYFIDINGFDKLKFVESIDKRAVSKKVLYVVSPGQLPPEATRTAIIKNLKNQPVFEVGETIK